MTSVLVTGGAGFIGTGLVHRLVGDGMSVVVADHLHPQVHPDASALDRLPDGVDHHAVDITHAPAVDALIRIVRPDVIVHLAAETGTGQSLSEASRHGAVNVLGTTNLLDALTRARHTPERIVLTSSRAVYGEGAWRSEAGQTFYAGQRTTSDLAAGVWDPASPDGSPARPLAHDAATIEPRPTNIYAATKLAQELLINAWCNAYEVDASVLRLQNVYGPGQSPSNSYTGVLTFFAVRALSGQPIEVFEDGQIIRDFVYVDDVVAALGSAVKQGVGGRTLDVGSGRPSTISEAAHMIAELADAPAPVVTGAYRLGDVRAAFAAADPTAVRTSLSEGLAALIGSLSTGGS
jgi:dTDP-L-rhamnose 4-epimerase